jgi:type IV pilus assembly protein PilA
MKKGFTLAELLAVIVILGIIAVITVPIVTKTLADYKVRLCNNQISNIESAARVWGSDNLLSLPDEDGETLEITLKQLQDEGYIGTDIKDPSKSDTLIENVTITITRVGQKQEYTVGYTCGS